MKGFLNHYVPSVSPERPEVRTGYFQQPYCGAALLRFDWQLSLRVEERLCVASGWSANQKPWTNCCCHALCAGVCLCRMCTQTSAATSGMSQDRGGWSLQDAWEACSQHGKCCCQAHSDKEGTFEQTYLPIKYEYNLYMSKLPPHSTQSDFVTMDKLHRGFEIH